MEYSLKPETLQELVGNRTAFRRAEEWLETSQNTHNTQNTQPLRPLLLLGPEGVGKTLFIELFAKHHLYVLQEFAASGLAMSVFLEKANGTHFVFGGSRKLIVIDELESAGAQDKMALTQLESYIAKHKLLHTMVISGGVEIEKRPALLKACEVVRLFPISSADISRHLITFNSALFSALEASGKLNELSSIGSRSGGSLRQAAHLMHELLNTHSTPVAPIKKPKKLSAKQEKENLKKMKEQEQKQEQEQVQEDEERELENKSRVTGQGSLTSSLMRKLDSVAIRNLVVGDVSAVISTLYENMPTELGNREDQIESSPRFETYMTMLDTLCVLDTLERRMMHLQELPRGYQEECLICILEELNQYPKIKTTPDGAWLGGSLWTRGSLKIQNWKRIQQLHSAINIPSGLTFDVSDFVSNVSSRKSINSRKARLEDRQLFDMATKRNKDFAMLE